MYSNNLRLSFFEISQINVIFVQLERFLRYKVIVFHALTYLWHLWLTYHSLVAVWFLFRDHWDIVERTCGFGSQYLTVWNQVIVQLYFNACFVMDVIELKFRDKFVPVRNYLKVILPYSFTSLVFPVSFLVAINFWTYYSIQHEMIDEDDVMHLYIPHWINHGLHTTIILLVLVEKILVRHSYPPKMWGYIGVCSILVSYAATCTALYTWSGIWPYPLIRGMSTIGKISFVILNCFLGMFFVVLGQALNDKVWGGKITENVKKSEKVS